MALAASLVSLATFVAIYGLFATGLNLKFGFTGLLDIGHVAFFLVGGYTAALLVLPPSSVPSQGYATYILGLQWTWPAAIAAAAVVAGVAGMLVALPSIRLREDYLAISVLGISVIAKRVIQTESWLANGPTSLKGWSKPLSSMFPLPGGAESFDLVLFGFHVVDVTLVQVPSPVLFGAIVVGVWSTLLYGVASYLGERDDSTANLAVHGLFAVLTLGFGYLATRRGRRDDERTRYALVGGVVAGVLAAALGFVGSSVAVAVPGAGVIGFYRAGVGLFIGLASLQTWALGGVVLADYYQDLPRRDATMGVALAVGLLLVFAPVVLLGGTEVRVESALAFVLSFAAVGLLLLWLYTRRGLSPRDAAIGGVLGVAPLGILAPGSLAGSLGSSAALATTLVLLAIYVVAVHFLRTNWQEYGSGSSFRTVAGFGVGTLFLASQAAFARTVLLVGSGQQSTAGTVVTFELMILYAAAVYYLGDNWERYGSGGAYMSVIGVAAVTLFAVRYFLLTLIDPFKAGNVMGAVTNTVVNLLWLVRIQGGLVLNYSRFRLLLVLFALAGTYYVVERTVRSPFGRALKAVRDDEDVASALGKNTFRFKVQTMILGSAIAGLAGALFAMWFGALVHTMFRPRLTFFALLIVVVGGTANNRGVVLGAMVLFGFRRATAELKSFFPPALSARVAALRIALIGALFIVILYYRPSGIWTEQSTSMEEIE